MSATSNGGNNSISEAEITELTNCFDELLKEIDAKTAILQSASPPKKSVVYNAQENDTASTTSNTIHYTCSPDNEDADITNVAAYLEVDLVEEQLPVLDVNNDNISLSSDLDSVIPDITPFSPVTPKSPKFDNIRYESTVSLETISSIETISRPELEINNAQINAFVKLDDSPFHLFNMSHLDAATNGYKKLGARSVTYYGEYPYSYSTTEHLPRKFEENSYLTHILSYIKIVLPDLRFNSAMLHKYDDGGSFMPHHADNEDCIEDGTDIVSISLGDSRWMEFKDKSSGMISNAQLMHGDVLIMSKSSQRLFTHSITAEPEKGARMSITLRQIRSQEIVSDESDTQSTVTEFLCHLENREETVRETNVITDGYQDQNDVHHEGYQNQYLPPVQPSFGRQHASQHLTSKPYHNNFQSNSRLQSQGVKDHRTSQFHWFRKGWQPPKPRPLPMQNTMPTQMLPIPPRHNPPVPTSRNDLNSSKFPSSQLHPSRQPGNSRRDYTFKPIGKGKKEEIVYISSSMFADMDPAKLSTEKVNAHVFFYRGADSYRMMDRMRRDDEVQKLSRQNTVSKVFLLTGSNNVDPICNNKQSMRDACSSVSQTINYVKDLFPSALLNVISILPRVNENRKNVIGQLNSHIKNLVLKDNSGRLCYIDTYEFKLFTEPNGLRRSSLFKSNYNSDTDNVHLNDFGIRKLGGHLKYLSHI